MPPSTYSVIPAEAGIHFPAARSAVPMDYSAVL